MKTLPLPLALICLLCAVALTAKAHSPPPVLADTINVAAEIGNWPDCSRRGKLCLSSQLVVAGEAISPNADFIGRAWFDGTGHLVMEVRQVLDTELWNELESSNFLLEANIPVSEHIMAGLGKQGQSYLLKSGVHPVMKQPDGSYRIVF
jgi:hypothetical protein